MATLNNGLAAMWWIRRPKGSYGFPQKNKEFKPAKWLILTICLLGLLMPAAGISMALIALGDWLLQRRRPRAAAAPRSDASCARPTAGPLS